MPMNQLRMFLVGLWSALSFVGSTAAPIHQAAPPSRNLQREFSTSSNLRAFALNAMNRPSEGGIFYALYAASICGRDFAAISRLGNARVAKEIASKATASSSRLTLVTNLGKRCSAFTVGEAGAMWRSLKARDRDSGDPLLAAEQQFIAAWKSRRPDMMRAAVARLMHLDDPLLWTEHRLNRYLAQFDPEANRTSGIFLLGKVYNHKDGLKTLEASIALDLGFCKKNLPCALDDELQVGCALGQDCAPDRDQNAKHYLFANGGTEENWRNVLALVSEVQVALGSRNVAIFVR
jgi:hypothetical protein